LLARDPYARGVVRTCSSRPEAGQNKLVLELMQDEKLSISKIGSEITLPTGYVQDVQQGWPCKQDRRVDNGMRITSCAGNTLTQLKAAAPIPVSTGLSNSERAWEKQSTGRVLNLGKKPSSANKKLAKAGFERVNSRNEAFLQNRAMGQNYARWVPRSAQHHPPLRWASSPTWHQQRDVSCRASFVSRFTTGH